MSTPKANRKQKRQRRSARPRCSAHVDRLYKAVQNYVEKNGGKLAVIGGITIQEWPADSAMVFHVAVKCCGRKPVWVEPNTRTERCGRPGAFELVTDARRPHSLQ